MRYNYCTLFDTKYLDRGILMHKTLMKNSKNAYLYIFSFDDDCYKALKRINLERTKIISLKEFENNALLKIKKTRTKAEYCWTCSSSAILHILKKYGVQFCTYLDADIVFYKDSSVLIKEMGNNSILLTEHRYTKEHNQTNLSGKYCVQFITFKNNKNGLKALNWWIDRCIEWCYNKREDGKFGDQKYLDDWINRFDGVHVSRNLGAGVAPWNIQQYKNIINNSGRIKNHRTNFIFYHYHGLKFYKNGWVDFGGYGLNNDVIDNLYVPILKSLIKIRKKLKDKYNVDLKMYNSNISFNQILRIIYRRARRRYNFYKYQILLDKYKKKSYSR